MPPATVTGVNSRRQGRDRRHTRRRVVRCSVGGDPLLGLSARGRCLAPRLSVTIVRAQADRRPIRRPPGGVAEWLKAHAWKACLRETVTGVRIPLPPPAAPIKPFSNPRHAGQKGPLPRPFDYRPSDLPAGFTPPTFSVWAFFSRPHDLGFLVRRPGTAESRAFLPGQETGKFEFAVARRPACPNEPKFTDRRGVR